MADDIPPSKILSIEEYMDKHKEEIVDFIEKKISQNARQDVKITGEIFDRLVNQLTIEMPLEMPFGPATGMAHIILANALVCSLWCGWLAQAVVNKKDPTFKEEYLDQFQRAITKAYDIGRGYAKQRP